MGNYSRPQRQNHRTGWLTDRSALHIIVSMAHTTQRLAYRVTEAATLLGVHVNTLWKRIGDGRIGVVRDDGLTLVPASEIERYLTPETRQRADGKTRT